MKLWLQTLWGRKWVSHPSLLKTEQVTAPKKHYYLVSCNRKNIWEKYKKLWKKNSLYLEKYKKLSRYIPSIYFTYQPS